jgi:hypothetical protein
MCIGPKELLDIYIEMTMSAIAAVTCVKSNS